nr:sensor histidine kinase [uncultured Gemmiger sp.]
MEKPNRPFRISLFAKFAVVTILLGILPIVLLTTVMQRRMLSEYRDSLETVYEDAISYSAYSIRARLDDYTDLSKFCYYYNYSSQGDFSYDYNNYDNLHKILTGEYFKGSTNVQESIRREMGLFLNYLNKTDPNIEASHFVYAPQGATPVSYHMGNYNNSYFNDELFLEMVNYSQLDTTSRNMLLIPTHKLDYIRFRGSRTEYVLTVGRNYYDITGSVGNEKYLGTLLIDLRTDTFDQLFETLNLTEGGTVYVTDNDGHCYFSSDASLVGQTLDVSLDPDHGEMRLSEEIPEYGLTVWCTQSRLPIETQIQAMRRVMALVTALSLVCLLLGAMFFSRRLTQPLRNIIQHMGQVESGNFSGRIPVTSNDELGDLTRRFNRMSAELDTYTKQVYISKIKQTEAELNALKSQIYPHFLYNTLEIIRMTAVSRQDNMVAEMVEALSDQIRYVIGTVNDLVPLRKEIDILNKYVYLLNCRFNNKVSFSCSCGRLTDCLIPKLILQPIVENAFIHGIKPMDGPGHIQLGAETVEDKIVLTVMDNGVGMTKEEVNRIYALLDSDQPGEKKDYEWGSIGLKNVHDRLRYLYGSEYGISLFSTPGVGTVIHVTIPGNLRNLDEKEIDRHAENAHCG